jgi:hypothetical protein
MSGLGVLAFFVWLALFVSFVTWTYAMFDSLAAVERTNEKRKHGFDEFGFW